MVHSHHSQLARKTAFVVGMLVLVVLGARSTQAQDGTDPQTVHNACAGNCVADTVFLHSGMGDAQARNAFHGWFDSYYALTGCGDPAWKTDILFLFDIIGDAVGAPGAPTMQCWQGLAAQASLCSSTCSDYFIPDARYAPNVALSLDQGSPGYVEVTLDNQSNLGKVPELQPNAYSRQFPLRTFLRYGDGERLLVNETAMPSLSFPNWITRGGLANCSTQYGFESERCQLLSCLDTPSIVSSSVEFPNGVLHDLTSQVSDLSDANGSFTTDGYIRLLSDGDSITINQGPYAGYSVIKSHFLSSGAHTVRLVPWNSTAGPVTITNHECNSWLSTCWVTGTRNETDTYVFALQGPEAKVLEGTYTVEVVADIPHDKDFVDNQISYSYDATAAQEGGEGAGGEGGETQTQRVEDLPIIDLPGPGRYAGSVDPYGLGMLFRLAVPDNVAFMFVRLVSRDGGQYDAFARRGSLPVPDYPQIDNDFACWAQATSDYSGGCPFVNPYPDAYYFFVHRWQGGGLYQLEVEWTLRSTPTPTPTTTPTPTATPMTPPTAAPETGGGQDTTGTEVEPNDGYATANSWNRQGPFTGSLASRSDIDVLVLDFTQSGIYTFSLTDVGPLARFRLTLRRGTNHNLLDSSTATGIGQRVDLTFDASVGEQYYLLVSPVAASFDTAQAYTLSLSDFIPDPDEPNDDWASATEWDITQGPVQGHFWDQTTGRFDYFTFVAPVALGADPVTFDLTNPSAELRVRLTLLRANGQLIANTVYSPLGQPVTLSRALEAGQRYYVKLETLFDRTSLAPYTLSAQFVPGTAASPTAPPTATVLPTATRMPLRPTAPPRPTSTLAASATLVPSPTAMPTGTPASSTNLIRNGDFSQGMAGWTVERGCESCGMQTNIDPSCGDYLAWARDNSGSNGGTIWARQALGIDVSTCQQLHLVFDVRVDAQTLPNSGWWTDEHGGDGEYPAMVRLAFMPAYQGSPFDWSEGFLIVHDGATQASNWVLVPGGTWWHYEADILSPAEWVDAFGNVLTNPGLLTDIYVGGSGWDFIGGIDNLALTGVGCG